MAEKISKKDANIKKMADLLRGGATMLSDTCPDCKVPIFRLATGEMICPGCNRRVVFTKSSDVEKIAAESNTTSELEMIMLEKINQIKDKLAKTDDPEELGKLSRSLSSLFETLEKIRKTKV